MYALARAAAASALPALPSTVLGAYPLDDTQVTYVHMGVNQVVT